MLHHALTTHRAIVSEEFAAMLMPEHGQAAGAPVADVRLWQLACDEALDAATLEASGFVPGAELADALLKLPQASPVRAMSPRSRERLDRLLPQLLSAARATPAPVPSLLRLCRLMQAVARRSSYLALLDEQPFRRADIAAEIARVLGTLDERDAETELERITEFRSSTAFRLGLAFNDGRVDAVATSRRLAALAESVVGAVLALAERDLVARHGRLPGAGSGFAVLGYGSLGGEELGFASDLDLVFVFDGRRAQALSDGARPLEGYRWYQRLAQRVMNWLTVLTRAGRLYEVDTRLRPDGSKGLLVSSLEAFIAYQESRAWTWEHQALLRARPVAGDTALNRELAAVRRAVLAVPRKRATVLEEVSSMRQRWRTERDRSDENQFDLKQGHGGLLDIEFALQGLALVHALSRPELLEVTANARLIEACCKAGVLDADQAATLSRAHAELLQRALACTLDLRSRIAPREPMLDALCADVRAVTASLGFAF